MTPSSRIAGGFALAALVAIPACGGGTGKDVAASPQSLQDKMAIVQQQYQAEQAVLAKGKDTLLGVVSGGGARQPATLLDVLEDPTVLLSALGDELEATATSSPDGLLVDWSNHADVWCAQAATSWDDDFFLVYGGPHVLSALVAFLDSACGRESAASLVAAADARGRGDGMVVTRNPDAGVNLDELLARLDAPGD
ncbi:MAG TPA: hypothetical protein VMK16_12405 [Acidimicrobiales bacterium]|nr:hypothetical protein [Acidimicrobiales bacterium]